MKATWSKQTMESEEEGAEMWVPQVEVEFMNVVWAMHSLVLCRVVQLEEWRKEVRADQEVVAEDRRILWEFLMGREERMERAEPEKGKEMEMGTEEAEKEDGEVEVESRLKQRKGILQALPSMPPSA